MVRQGAVHPVRSPSHHHRRLDQRESINDPRSNYVCCTFAPKHVNEKRSAVRDNVTGAGVAYPLFRKGVEKERFDRGVYLLGRDVEQMLTSRGVPAKRGAGQLLRNLERLMSIEGV